MGLNPGVRSQAATSLPKTYIDSVWPRNWGLEAFEPNKHGLVARVAHFRTIYALAYKSITLRRGLKGSTPRPGGLCLTAHTNSEFEFGTLTLCLLLNSSFISSRWQESCLPLRCFTFTFIYCVWVCGQRTTWNSHFSHSSMWVPGILGLVENTPTYWAILLFLVCLKFIEKYNKEKKNQEDVGQALQHRTSLVL